VSPLLDSVQTPAEAGDVRSFRGGRTIGHRPVVHWIEFIAHATRLVEEVVECFTAGGSRIGAKEGFITLPGAVHHMVNAGCNLALAVSWEPPSSPDMPENYKWCTAKCDDPYSVTAKQFALSPGDSIHNNKDEDDNSTCWLNLLFLKRTNIDLLYLLLIISDHQVETVKKWAHCLLRKSLSSKTRIASTAHFL
jgi:hypothetical protein